MDSWFFYSGYPALTPTQWADDLPGFSTYYLDFMYTVIYSELAWDGPHDAWNVGVHHWLLPHDVLLGGIQDCP